MKITPWSAFLVLGSLAFALAACSTSSSSPVSSTPVPAAPVVLAKPAAPLPPVVTAAPVAGPGIDFDQQVKPFFEKYCYSCHDVDGKAAGLGFDNKSGILQALQPGDAEDSLLYNVLVTRKMPQGRTKPTMAEIEMIRQWINEGAKVSASIPAEG
jgi:uncharacterized membrane protein